MFRVILCILLFGTIQIEGAKILMLFNAISRSHFILGEALGLGLANKGHEVTMISPFKTSEKHENYSEIVLDDAFETSFAKIMQANLFELSKQSKIQMMSKLTTMGIETSNSTFYHPDVQKLLKSGKHFDIFIAEAFLNECLLGMAHHLGAIPMMVSTSGTSTWTNKMVGNPYNPAYDTNFLLPYSSPFTYKERLASVAFALLDEIFYSFYIRNQDALFEEHFRTLNGGQIANKPDLTSLITNVSLVLLNTNIAVSAPRAYVPNMIPIGGFHVKPKKLPTDLQKILDESTQGVIYFSMGSNLKSAKLPLEKREAILKTFARLNHTVLWKWEDDKLPNQPKNVIIKSWMPQQSILAHPNVKLFITHGGLLSSIEALYFGMPLVGIPIFGDQPSNMARASKSGYALKIDLDEINEDSFTEVLFKVLGDPSYRKRAQYLSKIFRDQPQSPLDTAVSSIEYVLRHKGAPFLRSAATKMPMYQKLLLDVAAGLIVIVMVPLLMIYWICRKVYKKCCCKNVNSEKKNA